MWMVASRRCAGKTSCRAESGAGGHGQGFELPRRLVQGQNCNHRPKCRSEYAARALSRSEIRETRVTDLRAGMFATFVSYARAARKTRSAVPQDAVIREGDGSMTVWTTKDGHTFFQRVIKTGLSKRWVSLGGSRRAKRRRACRHGRLSFYC